MAWWQEVLQQLYQRPQIDGPAIGDELSPIGAFYAHQMQLGSQRIKKYKDYTDMAADTLISGALDIYADEVTQYDRVQGSSIWPVAKNRQVGQALRKLLDNIEAEQYLHGLARYLSCMGDNFVHPLFSSQTGGIVGMEFVDAEDVERIVDKFNRLVGFRYGGQRKLLDPWSFIHFRIVSRTQSVKLGGGIYGTSMLENARKTWRQLTLLEDALVVYRLELGGRHRVFYIDVGNTPYERALRIVRLYKREFGKRQYYNPQSGEWTSRFNPLHLTSDIFWPVRKNSESRIDYLGTDPNVASIVDIDYFRNKLFAALKIPKAYLGGDEYSSTRYGLSQIDIQFARTVKRLQRAIKQGFYRMGQVHLKLCGINPLDPMNDFDLEMAIISTLDQEQRIMAMDLSIQLAAKLKDLGLAIGIPEDQLNSYIARHILGLSPHDLRIIGQDPEVIPQPGQLTSGVNGEDAHGSLVTEAFQLLREDPEIDRITRLLRYQTGADEEDRFRKGANRFSLEQLQLLEQDRQFEAQERMHDPNVDDNVKSYEAGEEPSPPRRQP